MSGVRSNVAAALLLLLLAFAAAHVEARSWDLFWHLETGEQIAATGAIPRADDFSFSSGGTPWVDHEWLFQRLMYAAWTSMGPQGLAVLKGGAALLAALAGYVALRRRSAGAGLSLGVVALCVAGMRFRLTERPELATLAAAPLAAALLGSLASRPVKPVLRLGALAALTILWVNMHAGALLAPLLAAACLLAVAAAKVRARGPGGTAGIAVPCLALAATTLAPLVNPYGYRIYTVPLEIARALAPANLLNPEWLAPSPLKFPFLFAALAACAALLVAALRTRVDVPPPHLAMLVLTAAMALLSVRHIGVFFAILPVVLPFEPLGRFARSIPAMAAGALGVVAAVFMFFVPPGGAQRGFGIASGRFPETAADFIDRQLGDARLYNDARFGGYLIWRGYPGRRVFLDGRNEVHAALLADLSASLDDGRRWEELLARHDVEGAVVGYRDAAVRLQDGSAGTFSETHFPARRWALVHWDDVAMVFVRRESRFAAVAASESRARPEAFRLGLLEPELLSADQQLRNEILRKLAEDPDCALAKNMASVYGIGESIPTPETGR